MKIWMPSKAKLEQAQDIIKAQKELIDALQEKNASCEALIETLKNSLDQEKKMHAATRATKAAARKSYAELEAENKQQKEQLQELKEKMQLLEEGAKEAWMLKTLTPEVIKVKVRPHYVYCYDFDDNCECHIAHPSNVFRTEEAALKALEKYLITGKTENN